MLDQVSEALRTKHYAYRTEKTYVDWIKCYIIFHNKRHPKDLGAEEIREFITYLASERKVTTSTQNQALSAILFLYRTVLHKEITLPPELVNASRPKRLPTVLTHAEAMSVINSMPGIPRLMTKILYGSGLRLMECMRLRVKDIDFDHHQIIVRGSKGDDDCFTVLPMANSSIHYQTRTPNKKAVPISIVKPPAHVAANGLQDSKKCVNCTIPPEGGFQGGKEG